MAESLSIDFQQPIALFPLPNVVLLPHATVPLHIFEPRYRRMIKDALRTTRLIASAVFEGQEWKEDYQGQPAVRPIVCVGHIVRHQTLEDGRYNLLVQGVCRARIVQEVPHEPYRLAILEPLETQAPMEIDLSEVRQRIEKLLHHGHMKNLVAIGAIHKWLSPDVPTSVLVDLAIMTTTDDSEQRYRMLAESDPQTRAQWLEKQLRQLLQTLAAAARFEPPDLPDGVNVN